MNTKDLLTQRFWLASRLERGEIADITGQRAAIQRLAAIDLHLNEIPA